MQQFEFVVYDENVTEVERLSLPMRSDSAARSKAGTLSKQHKGPVDLAFAGSADWADRYITTASPSDFHAAGYRFERLI